MSLTLRKHGKITPEDLEAFGRLIRFTVPTYPNALFEQTPKGLRMASLEACHVFTGKNQGLTGEGLRAAIDMNLRDKDGFATKLAGLNAEQLSRLSIPPTLNNCLSGAPAGATS